MSDTLPADEIQRMTGYKRPADQLRELKARGFYRARLAKVTREVILERPHYDAVISGRAPQHAPVTFPLTKTRAGPVSPFPWEKRTALYRHLDRKGALLYVGIAVNPDKRTSAHRAQSPWAKRIATVDVQWFDTRREAVAAERSAIAAEAPPFNILHTGAKR